MPGLIDDSLRGMSDATDSMSAAVQARAQKFAQDIGLKSEMRQGELGLADTMHSMFTPPAGGGGDSGAPPGIVQIGATETQSTKEGLGPTVPPPDWSRRSEDVSGGDDWLPRSGGTGSRTEPLWMPQSPDQLWNSSELLGGIGQRLAGGFLNNLAQPIGSDALSGGDQ